MFNLKPDVVARLELDAIQWSHDKSKRCGRTAYQFAKNHVGRYLLPRQGI